MSEITNAQIYSRLGILILLLKIFFQKKTLKRVYVNRIYSQISIVKDRQIIIVDGILKKVARIALLTIVF